MQALRKNGLLYVPTRAAKTSLACTIRVHYKEEAETRLATGKQPADLDGRHQLYRWQHRLHRPDPLLSAEENLAPVPGL